VKPNTIFFASRVLSRSKRAMCASSFSECDKTCTHY